MKNIYDQRKEEQLLYILDTKKGEPVKGLESSALIMNLYYHETLDRYIRYIKGVPEDIAIYVCSSDELLLKEVKENANRKNLSCVKKQNRGRDISALLVAAKAVIPKYDQICFIHDKSPNADYLCEDVEAWITNLWDNMLASPQYIHNVLRLFEEQEELGLLVPPEPYGEFSTHWYGDTWREDFELTKELAVKLNLNTDVSREKEVFTLGTVFWARTAALKKLLDYPWLYEDFPVEPLPIDGTISHAIERIIGYVAQDAGYKTGTIMTNRYAAQALLRAQEDMRIMFDQLRKREHVHNLHQIKNLDEWENELKAFCEAHKYIYIYGAGVYGKSIEQFMRDRKWKLDGFIVSPGQQTVEEVEGIPVLELNELSFKEESGCIIGVSYEYRDEIEKLLKEHAISNYMNGF